MRRPRGHLIPAHRHNEVTRQVGTTQEVLFIRSGRVRVDLYSLPDVYLTSRVLEAGDFILLSAGGHGLEMLEESEIVEVKQGPYAGEADKTRFRTVDPSLVRPPQL